MITGATLTEPIGRPTVGDQQLFEQYLNVVNEAIRSSRFPYSAMVKAADRLLSGKDIGVVLYDREDREPDAEFTLRMEGGAFELVTV